MASQTSLIRKTFESAGVISNEDIAYNPTTTPFSNLFNLNLAVQDSIDHGEPVYGLGKTYTIAQTVGPDDPRFQSIVLKSNCHIICLPGCRIIRGKDFNSVRRGVVSGGVTNGELATNARWIGGQFVGEPWTDPTNPEAGTQYPPGEVFRVAGHNLRLENITIDGFGAADDPDAADKKRRGGIAMALWGNRIRVINPQIIHPYIPSASTLSALAEDDDPHSAQTCASARTVLSASFIR